MFQKASGILETCDDQEGLSRVLCNIGIAYTRIEAWDDSITALKKSISIAASIEFEVTLNPKSQAYQVLGWTHIPRAVLWRRIAGWCTSIAREEVMRKASICSQEAMNLLREDDPRKPKIYLDLAQAHYFLGDMENAELALKKCMDKTLK